MEDIRQKIKNKAVTANIYNYKTWLLVIEPTLLKKSMDWFLEKVGYSVLSFSDYTFPNGGYTALWLLAESHLAVHTFPEAGKTYVELSGCNREMNNKFEQVVGNWKEEGFPSCGNDLK